MWVEVIVNTKVYSNASFRTPLDGVFLLITFLDYTVPYVHTSNFFYLNTQVPLHFPHLVPKFELVHLLSVVTKFNFAEIHI